MIMLIIQHNYRYRYKSTIMIMEIILSIKARLVILQEHFIRN